MGLLSIYTDRLHRGQGYADRLLRQYGSLSLEMVALLALAQRLKRTLAPVPAPEPFRSQLQRDLLSQYDFQPVSTDNRRWRPLWYSLAAVGSVLPLLGIVVWRRRRRSHVPICAN